MLGFSSVSRSVVEKASSPTEQLTRNQLRWAVHDDQSIPLQYRSP